MTKAITKATISTLFLFSFLINPTTAQSIVQNKQEQAIPSLLQELIDSLTGIASGYTVFNLTTGCLNYFFDNKWFEVCGNCIPQPKIPIIDSIVQQNNLLRIYFQPINKILNKIIPKFL